MTYSTPSTTISATVPTPASAGSRQAAESWARINTKHLVLLSPSLYPGTNLTSIHAPPQSVRRVWPLQTAKKQDAQVSVGGAGTN